MLSFQNVPGTAQHANLVLPLDFLHEVADLLGLLLVLALIQQGADDKAL